MRLLDLNAQLLRCEMLPSGQELHPYVDELSRAHGVMFLCPACFKANSGSVGTHSVLVWFANRGVPDAATPAPRWAMSGTSLADLTLSPSIQIPCWHGFVTGGIVR